jgi:hypothetical protein
MLKVDVQVNTSGLNTKLNKVQQGLAALPQQTLDEFKKNTPIRSGNARRRTRLSGNSIEANYPYAQRLEDNWSSQTKGQGIIEPTLKWLRNRIKQLARIK